MKTQHCAECKHSTYLTKEKVIKSGIVYSYREKTTKHTCDKGHNPRFYKPKYEFGLDNDFGYKRKCEDFEAVLEENLIKKSNNVAEE